MISQATHRAGIHEASERIHDELKVQYLQVLEKQKVNHDLVIAEKDGIIADLRQKMASVSLQQGEEASMKGHLQTLERQLADLRQAEVRQAELAESQAERVRTLEKQLIESQTECMRTLEKQLADICQKEVRQAKLAEGQAECVRTLEKQLAENRAELAKSQADLVEHKRHNRLRHDRCQSLLATLAELKEQVADVQDTMNLLAGFVVGPLTDAMLESLLDTDSEEYIKKFKDWAREFLLFQHFVYTSMPEKPRSYLWTACQNWEENHGKDLQDARAPFKELFSKVQIERIDEDGFLPEPESSPPAPEGSGPTPASVPEAPEGRSQAPDSRPQASSPTSHDDLGDLIKGMEDCFKQNAWLD